MARGLPLFNARRLSRYGSAFRVDLHTVVKTGENVYIAEAEVMRFVRENTTIPVPGLHDTYQDEESGHFVIVMDFIEGERLDVAWEGYTNEEKEVVIAQLRDYMRQLRQFKGTFIGSIDGTCCNDAYFCDGVGGYGPYPAEDEFNQGILEAMRKDRPWPYVEYASELWLSAMKGHDSVLTHNGFEPRNILVDGSEIVAILDWECAGYYPEYWEYCKALRRPDWNDSWTASRAIDCILEPYFAELSVVWSCSDIFY